MTTWHAAIAFALVGQTLPLPPHASPDVDALVVELDGLGWTRDRLAERARRDAALGPWPHPVPDALRRGLGAAQLHAAVQEARRRLGLEVLDVRGPSTRTTLNADERRLQADVPPHY